jgi:uncharacterized protein YcaQ
VTATLTVRAARRLALLRAGLLPAAEAPPAAAVTAHPPWGEAQAIPRRERRLRDRALAAVRRFGYLQIDSVSVAGARSHAIVLASRSAELPTSVGEELLRAGEPLFEFWGHEASWLPLELYPIFGFRRREFAVHPWWGDHLGRHRPLVDHILARLRAEGPLHTSAFETAARRPGGGFWDLSVEKKVLAALWSAGHVVVRERRGFQRIYDLPERALPPAILAAPELPELDAVEELLLLALAGCGWATRGTLAGTWRLRNRRAVIDQALRNLVERGAVVPCTLVVERPAPGERAQWPGYVRPDDLAVAAHLAEGPPPSTRRPVLLSPFDPLLWDRNRVALLFGFDATLEIFKPARTRRWGYYCLPVLAGERLVSRLDLKADRARGKLTVVARHDEPLPRRERARLDPWVDQALRRYAAQTGLALPAARSASDP